MKDETTLVHAGREVDHSVGVINPPVYHASTITYPSLDAFKNRAQQRYTGITYGLQGNPTRFALADAVAALEGAHKAIVVSSGLGAVTYAVLAFVKAGDHLLVSDSAYEPTRNFTGKVLARFGIEATFYDPRIGGGIAGLIRPNTRMILMESPGSVTFEVQDVPAIAAVAKQRGVLTLLDNTWATPLLFKPLAHGVDISSQAATKYVSGHSDVLLGVISVKTEEHFRAIKDMTTQLGDNPGPDDCYLALRGLRTMAVRLRQHEQSTLQVARWLQQRPEVARVLYPALPTDPGHALWKRDFQGACGLFGLLLRTPNETAVARLVDNLRLFKIGASWGGFESLVIPAYPGAARTAVAWKEPGFLLRLHIGLEDPEDLMADLADGFDRLNAALKAIA
jgi:cystathionine beta-lyase